MIDIEPDFPKLNDYYKIALNEALAWVCLNFKPIGIIVTGSIMRGNPDLNSDFDIFVIHEDSRGKNNAYQICHLNLVRGCNRRDGNKPIDKHLFFE